MTLFFFCRKYSLMISAFNECSSITWLYFSYFPCETKLINLRPVFPLIHTYRGCQYFCIWVYAIRFRTTSTHSSLCCNTQATSVRIIVNVNHESGLKGNIIHSLSRSKSVTYTPDESLVSNISSFSLFVPPSGAHDVMLRHERAKGRERFKKLVSYDAHRWHLECDEKDHSSIKYIQIY